MIDLNRLNRFRVMTKAVAEHYGGFGDERCGAFEVPSPIDGKPMFVIASSGEGWDHVSVSRQNRAPNQVEMADVFRLFFADGEIAVQFFVPRADHVNIHETCLHLWRSQTGMKLPPRGFV